MAEPEKLKRPRGEARLIPGKCIACGARCEAECPKDAVTMNDVGEPIIDLEKCTRCRRCIKVCPADAITGEANHLHTLHLDKCTSCGACFDVCPKDAIGFTGRSN